MRVHKEPVIENCKACGGSGELGFQREACWFCGGTGEINRDFNNMVEMEDEK